jgi:nucleoside 2-deoxyribosyltransferase
MKIYIALPYTWNAERSFEIANKVSALYMQMGHIVFSPISHSHPVADYMDDKLRYDQCFWMAQDLPFIEWADAVVVVVIGDLGQELITNSKGVQAEIAHAKLHKKPITIHEYYD